MESFETLGLNKNILKVLEELKIDAPTEIQVKVIPLALKGQDLIGGSATGSGKTLAFAVPLIEMVKSKEGLQALVITPTRELAEQVSRALKQFSRYNILRINTVYGGVPIGAQIRNLKNSEVVVGTPGRLLDHLSRKTINLSKIKLLVLDEADQMFDMGFIHDVTDIIHECPTERQTLLFSATISNEVISISKRYMKNPQEISAESNVDPSKLKQVFYDVPSNQKFSLLVHLLKKEKSGLVMIFCNTKRNADLVSNNLGKNGFNTMALHGNLSQNKRNYVLDMFHKSERFVLVCTDVAARGLDIKNVSHVYNYEFPKTKIEYIHRIGRTARAGEDGKAITLLSDRDFASFRNATRYDSGMIENVPLPIFERVHVRMSETRGDTRYSSRKGSRGRSSRNNSGGSKGGPRRSSSRSSSRGPSRDSRGPSRSPRSSGGRRFTRR